MRNIFPLPEMGNRRGRLTGVDLPQPTVCEVVAVILVEALSGLRLCGECADRDGEAESLGTLSGTG